MDRDERKRQLCHFLTEKEAAELLRIKPDTLRHWRMRYRSSIPFVQVRPWGRVLYGRDALLAWVRAKKND